MLDLVCHKGWLLFYQTSNSAWGSTFCCRCVLHFTGTFHLPTAVFTSCSKAVFKKANGSAITPAVMHPKCIVIMGVSGCGKTTIGKILASKIGADFIEGDDFHSSENRNKMANGIPLTDEDRLPWLNKLSEVMRDAPAVVVMACSALKKKYRSVLKGNNEDGFAFIHLNVGRSELERRLRSRRCHFFNPKLLDSQIECLEVPSDEEGCHVVDANGPVEKVTSQIVSLLNEHYL